VGRDRSTTKKKTQGRGGITKKKNRNDSGSSAKNNEKLRPGHGTDRKKKNDFNSMTDFPKKGRWGENDSATRKNKQLPSHSMLSPRGYEGLNPTGRGPINTGQKAKHYKKGRKVRNIIIHNVKKNYVSKTRTTAREPKEYKPANKRGDGTRLWVETLRQEKQKPI